MKPFSDGSTQTNSVSGCDILQAGFAPGAIALTLDGEIPVEFLGVGDRVITRDSGMAVLRGVRSHIVRCDVVEITGGALGHTRPERDVILPADQKLLLRDWRAKALYGAAQALAPVRALVDGEFVRLGETRDMRLYQLEFDTPHILYVDGLEMACEPMQDALKTAA